MVKLNIVKNIYDALYDLVPFVQFKKLQTLALACNLDFIHRSFSRFINCANGTKLCKASYMFSLIIFDGCLAIMQNRVITIAENSSNWESFLFLNFLYEDRTQKNTDHKRLQIPTLLTQ